MPIPLLRKSGFILVLLVAFHFSVIQTSHSSEKYPDKVSGLQKQAGELQTKGYYDKAIPIVKEVLALKRATLGGKKAEVAQSLDLLGKLHYQAGKYPEAESFLKESLSMRMELFGPNHTETAESFDHSGTLYNLTTEYAKAENYLNDALKIRETAYGKDHPDVAKTLVNLAKVQINKDNRDKAEPLLNRALVIQEKSLGPEHPDLTRTLNTLAWMYIDTDNFEKAEPYCRRALEISEKAFGPEHPYCADSLNYLGRVYGSRKEYDKSIEANKRALAIREKFLGPDHPDVGLSMNNLALTYCGLQRYDKAMTLLPSALQVLNKSLGSDHPYLLDTLRNTGSLYEAIGRPDQALSFYQKALEISKKQYGQENLNIAKCRKDLARIYFYLGDLNKSESLANASLITFENTFRKDHQLLTNNIKDYIDLHQYLFAIYLKTRRYNEADELIKTGKTSLEKEFEANNETVALFVKSIEEIKNRLEAPQNIVPDNYQIAKSNLDIGNRYFYTEKYDKAEQYFQQVLNYCKTNSDQEPALCCKAMNCMGALKLSILGSDEGISLFKASLSLAQRHFPPDNIIMADTLVDIGHYYSSIADYKEALGYYEKALKVYEIKFAPDHPKILQIYFALGRLYFFENDTDKALKFNEKAMAGIEKTLGKHSELYARCLLNLGNLYYRNRQYDKAEQSAIQAIDIWEKVPGPTFISQAMTYLLLTHIYAKKGDIDKATNGLLKCHQFENQAIDQISDFTSENQQLNIVDGEMLTLRLYLNLIGKFYKQDPLKIQQAFDMWLKGKGRILDIQARVHESNIENDNPESVRLFQELNKVRNKLSRLVFSQPGTINPLNYKQSMDNLKVKKDQIEAQLSRISKQFASKQRIANADSNQIFKMLPDGAVLLEFARVEALIKNPNKALHSYIAFVLHSGEGHSVNMVDLGNADQIDDLIAQYKRQISKPGNENRQSVFSTSKKLCELVFKPLQKDIGQSREIFISPDGNLNLIPFEVLQQPDGQFLIQDYTFNYLAAGRDLLAFDGTSDGNGKYLLMGAPDFNLGMDKNPVVLADAKVKDKTGQQQTTRFADLKDVSFQPLRYAKAELEDIGQILGEKNCEIYTGKDALERVLREKSSYEFVHLATHGFFLSDQQLPGDGRGWDTVATPAAGKNAPIERKLDLQDPLLRSGILLAGARRSLLTGDIGVNDGIITAEKILGLNLHGTKMVVLSACDTGLGEVKSGEGVFGLRRAFTQAGAKSIVMSLWKVPDLETKELMVNFYKNIKSGKMNRCQALRQAALDEMKIVEKRQGYANPRYWGAFVFMREP